jgi:hypothetical protein
MSRVRSFTRLLVPAAILTVSACSDSPIAPATVRQAPEAPNLGLLTWYYLPQGAQWALIFDSSSGDGSLHGKVYHYPKNTIPGNPDPIGTSTAPDVVKGSFSFSISGTKLSGTLTPTSFFGDGTCVPWGVSCNPDPHFTYNGVWVIIPEGGTVTGTAVVNRKPTNFRLVFHSTQYSGVSGTPDWATLQLCSNLADPTTCGTMYRFSGQLHHEPT